MKICKPSTPQTKGKCETSNKFVKWLYAYKNKVRDELEIFRLIYRLNKTVNQKVSNQFLGVPPIHSIEYLKIYHGSWKCKTTEKKIVELMTSYSADLKIAYDFLHSFMVSYKKRNYETAKVKLKSLIDFLNFHNEISELYDLGKRLTNWQKEIENSFLLVDGKTINNAICEGINRKMKSLKNISFGITNFDHLRKRIFLIYKNFNPLDEDLGDTVK